MIYYIGYYNCDLIRHENRQVAPAAENKMSYIISVLDEIVDRTVVVSPARTSNHKIEKGKRQKITEKVELKTFLSFSSSHCFVRKLGSWLTQILFFLYLLLRVTSKDQMLIYHSLSYMRIIQMIKKIKKCKLVIEVEEIYADVSRNAKLRKKEIGYFQKADKYILITELLKKEINNEKDFVISHGTYKSIRDFGFRFNDGKIHVVYAGTFSNRKGGVYTALETARYLDSRYVLEILGNGSDSQIQTVKKKIEELSKSSKCKINYVGYKSGDDFNKYIQACHIGLSTQPIDASFNDTSFPSKVLMYMSNGLRVVSVCIPTVETSNVGKYIYFYNTKEAQGIADVIHSVSIDDGYDSRKILDSLHTEFVAKLRFLLQG